MESAVLVPVLNVVKDFRVIKYTNGDKALAIRFKRCELRDALILRLKRDNIFKLMDAITKIWTSKKRFTERVELDNNHYIEVGYINYKGNESMKIELYKFISFDKMEMDYMSDRVTLTINQSRILFRQLRGY